MIKQDEEYLRKAKERMRITRRCIDMIDRDEEAYSVMLLQNWKRILDLLDMYCDVQELIALD